MIEFIKRPDFFPAIIVTLQALAGIRYVFAGVWPNAMYWFCIVGVNVAATWLMQK